MSAVELGRFELDSPEWHEARRTRLGGSEIAAVLGRSTYESRFSLWHRKAGLIGPQPVNGEMIAGRYVEDACARWFQDRHPEFVVCETGTWVHSERAWQLANPDRLVYTSAEMDLYWAAFHKWAVESALSAKRRRGPTHPQPVAILECKFSPYGEGWGEEGTDEIPEPYLLQTRWYSSVFGDLPVHVAVLRGGSFGEWRVEQDRDDLAVMLTEGRAFLDSLESGDRPDIDDHEETYRAVRELHPEIEPNEDHELPEPLALEYLDSKSAYTAAERRHRRARAAVLDDMGTANYATWQGVRIARRQSSNGNTPHLASTRKDPREQKPARTTKGDTAA